MANTYKNCILQKIVCTPCSEFIIKLYISQIEFIIKVVSRYSDPQLQVGKVYSYLFILESSYANLDV